MMQVAPPPPPGLDPTFLFDQLMPIVGVIVLFVGLRWVFRTPVGDAIAERIRAGIHRRRHWKGFGGEWVDAPGEELSADRRVAVLEEQVSTLQGQLSELAERVDFAERMLAERRGRQEGRDDLAKQALLRHNEHAQGALQLHDTWVKHREETEKLKLSLRQLNDRIEEAKRKKNILIARQKRAEAHKRIQETMSSIGDKSVFETFERMTEQIEHEERKLIAAAEVNEDLSGDSLIKQFQGLEVKASADEQLLALKRKMGLLPGGTQEQARALGKGAKDAELLEDDDAEQKS